jgi:hypothetical protein
MPVNYALAFAPQIYHELPAIVTHLSSNGGSVTKAFQFFQQFIQVRGFAPVHLIAFQG